MRPASHHKFSGGGVCFLVQNRVVVKSWVERMSLDSRRIEKVFSVMQGIAEAGDGLVRVGAIADVLRNENATVPAWQLRADCTTLSNAGRITLDTASGAWMVASEQRVEGVA